MNPEGWTSAKINISFSRFYENAQLHLALGKPYSNNKISDAKTTVIISRTRVEIKTPSTSVSGECDLKDADTVKISVSEDILNVCNVTAPICADEINGYMEMFGDGGSIYMTEVCTDSDIEPYTEEKHNEVLLKWRHDSLDEADRRLDALEAYLKENPLPQKKGDIILPERLIDINTEMTVKVISYGSKEDYICTQSAVISKLLCILAISTSWASASPFDSINKFCFP